MAATDRDRRANTRSSALRALTAAAFALPGLAPQSAAADGDSISLGFQHYTEGERDLIGQTYKDLNLRPLEADSLSLGLKGTVSDRIKFSVNYEQDTWSGATPVTTVPYAAITDQLFSGASSPTEYAADSQHRPVAVNWDTYDGNTVDFKNEPRLVHVMASASPETRRQVDAKAGYEWDNTAIDLGGGVSIEPDYHSFFLNTDGRADFDQKTTTLNWSASVTLSNIAASLEANRAADWGNYLGKIGFKGGDTTLFASRRDFTGSLGVSQVLDKDTLVNVSLGYTRSQGYLSNPYKATLLAFDDPDQEIDSTGLRFVTLKGALEQRPTLRNEGTLDVHVVRNIGATDAALHVDYQYYRDDWGISAHTLNATWYQPIGEDWMVVPNVRYYSQTAASFYRPYFLFNQAFPILFPRNPELPPQLDFSQIALRHFSSDERLSGFGTLSAELAVDKQFRPGLVLELGANLSTHRGSLELGGQGEKKFADFNSYTLFANLNLDLAGRNAQDAFNDRDPAYSLFDGMDREARPAAFAIPLPAGVEFARLLQTPGQWAVSVRHTYGLDGGALQLGSHRVPGNIVTTLDCGGTPCSRIPTADYSHATSFDLLYAPASGWTVGIEPQFVDRHMDQERADFFFLIGPGGGPGGNTEPTLHHSTSGIGDTNLFALARIFGTKYTRLQAGLDVSIPTGSVDKRVNLSHDYQSYGLQIGSGTWDLKPNLTWLGQDGPFSFGAQLSATKRLQSRNAAGYALGDSAEATFWGGYRILDWLTASLRGVASVEDRIHGQFKPHLMPVQTGYTVVNGEPVPTYEYDPTPQTLWGPMDAPSNYGGRFFDVGFGLNFIVPEGTFAGDRLSVEWLNPIKSDVNGYQLARRGTLSILWDIDL